MEMDEPEERRNETVSWGCGVASDDGEDGEDSVSTNGYNAPADGLLTQPCDDDDDQSNDASEFHHDSFAIDQSKHAVQPKLLVLKSPNRSPSATKMGSLLNCDGEHGSNVKSNSRRLFAAAEEEEEIDDDDDIDSSSRTDKSESSDDSSREERTDLTPIQVRRARNIERHNAFAKSLNLGLLDRINGSSAPKLKSEINQKDDTIVEAAAAPMKRRGMIFPTRSGHKKPRQLLGPISPKDYARASQTAARELEAKYPCRTLQIKMISNELEKVVRTTKLAWHTVSSRKKLYSEAKHHGDVTFASPAPILVSGSGGTGKTSVVCDTINMIREKVDNISVGKSKSKMNKTNIISYAYVDCASAAGVDIAYVLNSAYKQLHGCYHPKSKHSYKSNDASEDNALTRTRADALISLQNIDEEIDMLDCDSEHAEEVDEADGDEEHAESAIEQERQTYVKGRKKRKRVSKNQSHNQSKGRSVKFRRDARQSTSSTTVTTKTASIGIKRSTRHHYDSSPVALFGRALAILLQGGLRKKRPKYGRCSILVLDNAERMLSWKRSGSLNALAQLFKLPGVMGLNLSIIFISRGSLLAHAGEFLEQL
jgi:nucleoside-triphosphatase THEP1